MISRAAYQGRTPDFWTACDGTAGPAFWRQFGTTGDAKGEPTQIVNSISHGNRSPDALPPGQRYR
jgi:TldD protein